MAELRSTTSTVPVSLTDSCTSSTGAGPCMRVWGRERSRSRSPLRPVPKRYLTQPRGSIGIELRRRQEAGVRVRWAEAAIAFWRELDRLGITGYFTAQDRTHFWAAVDAFVQRCRELARLPR